MTDPISNAPLCTRCDEHCRITIATEERFGEPLCGNCAQAEDERAYERQCERYHEGGGVSIAELSERAYAERAELRRRD